MIILDIELTRAITKAGQLVSQAIEHREHGIRHGCSLLCLYVSPALMNAITATKENKRASSVVMHVAITHRRTPDNEGLCKQILITVHRVLKAIEEIRILRHPVFADRIPFLDRLYAIAVM